MEQTCASSVASNKDNNRKVRAGRRTRKKLDEKNKNFCRDTMSREFVVCCYYSIGAGIWDSDLGGPHQPR